MTRSALAIAAVLSFAAGARAQEGARVVLLPPAGDAQRASEAEAAVVAELEARGARVERLSQLELPAEHRACSRTDCADEAASAAGADLAVGVAVWPGEEGGHEVAVTLVTPDGASFHGSAPAEHDVPRAARRALAVARDQRELGRGPWLAVRGEPAGAQVLVDGTPVGVVPYRGAVTPGTHRLVVRLAGHEPLERQLDVPLDEHHEAVLDVRLAPAGAVSDGGDRPVLGPVLLGAAGVASLGVAGYGLLAGSCERRDPAGECLKGQETDPLLVGVWAAGGALAIGGALLWHFLGGERSSEVRAAVGPTGLTVNGSF